MWVHTASKAPQLEIFLCMRKAIFLRNTAGYFIYEYSKENTFTRLSVFAYLGGGAQEPPNTQWSLFLNWQVEENKEYKTFKKAMIQLR